MRTLSLCALILLAAACDPALVDADGDGYCGDLRRNGEAVEECKDGSMPGDCDDDDVEIYPGASEYCDGVDTDCDGELDEPDAIGAGTWYIDLDQDGYGNPASIAKACEALPDGWSQDNTDCDDTDEHVNPGSTETPGNGADDDCNPATPD